MSKNLELQSKVLKWIFNSRNIGLSSKAMAASVCGHNDKIDHPYDPSDLNRCIKLCTEIPEIKESFNLIANLSPTWGKLINRWDELEKCFIDEVGFDWSLGKKAPKTYKLIKSIID
jgi:hypothetical protein